MKSLLNTSGVGALYIYNNSIYILFCNLLPHFEDNPKAGLETAQAFQFLQVDKFSTGFGGKLMCLHFVMNRDSAGLFQHLPTSSSA